MRLPACSLNAAAVAAGTNGDGGDGDGQPVHLKLLDDFDGFHRHQGRIDPTASEASFGEDFPSDFQGTFEHVPANFLQPDGKWTESLSDVDTVVHLAAVNPYPECTWAEAKASMDMTASVVAACQVAVPLCGIIRCGLNLRSLFPHLVVCGWSIFVSEESFDGMFCVWL